MKRRISNLWEFLDEFIKQAFSHADKHRWQARVMTIAVATSFILCSLSALIILIAFLINRFL